MKKSTKLFIIFIFLVIIFLLVLLSCFLFNKYNFLNTLEKNGYSKSPEGDFYIKHDENNILSKITVEKYRIFNMPEFQYEYLYPQVSIKFNDIKDDSKNIIYTLNVPTNMDTGKLLNISELQSLLNTENKESFLLNGSEVTKEEWLSASEEYISHIEAKYNEVKSMFE